ncbi:MAG: TlpA family protein disulfide reductase [Flavobacteriaceae bacterium]|nr:redoxin domain-containing protein [Psychroflexus sp.]
MITISSPFIRKSVFVILSAFLMASCQKKNAKKEIQNKTHSFKLTVNLSGDYPSEVYLKTDDNSLKSEVKNSQAIFKDTASYAKSARLFINDSTASNRFYLTKDGSQSLSLTVDKDSIDAHFFFNISAPISSPEPEKEIKALYHNYNKDEITFKSFSKKLMNFIESHQNHQVVGEIMTNLSQKNKISFEDLKALKQKTRPLNFQNEDAELFKRYFKIRKKYKKGKAFHPFKMKDLQQKTIELSQIKADLVYIEFWSTWSDTPLLKSKKFLDNYRFYKSKSYEVISISLNTNREIWMKNVVESNMPWTNLIAEQGYTSEVVTEMGIYNLPQNYLIDSEGHIVAKNINYDNLKTYQNLILN